MLPPPIGQRSCCRRLSFLARKEGRMCLSIWISFQRDGVGRLGSLCKLTHARTLQHCANCHLIVMAVVLSFGSPRTVSGTVKTFLRALLTQTRIESLRTFGVRDSRPGEALGSSTRELPSLYSVMEGRGNGVVSYPPESYNAVAGTKVQ